jgi:hypothetical protein
MAASDGRLPSMLPPSFDNADGEAGLRNFAASFLLLSGPIGATISIGASSDCIVKAGRIC